MSPPPAMIKKRFSYYTFVIMIFSLAAHACLQIYEPLPVETGLSYAAFIVVTWVLINIYVHIKWTGKLLDPVIIFSAWNTLFYYYGSIYWSFFSHRLHNFRFLYRPDEIALPMLVSTVGYILFMVGVFASASMNAETTYFNNFLRLFRPGKESIIVAGICTLFLLGKLIFVWLGWSGSLVSHNQPYTSSILFLLIKPFIIFLPMFIAYFSILYLQHNCYKNYLFIVIAFGIVLAIIEGNRRDIMYIVAPYFVIRYMATGRLLSLRQSVYVVALFVIYVYFSSAVESALYTQLAAHQNVNYIKGFFYGIYNIFEFVMNEPLAPVHQMFGNFNGLYLVNSAINIDSSGFELDVTPFFEFLKSLIPGAHSFALTEGGAHIQYPLFKESLWRSGEVPYLNLPLVAEAFMANGWTGLVFYSIFSGWLLYTCFCLSQKSKYLWLWYWSFFPYLSVMFVMSINAEMQIAIKALLPVYVFCTVTKVLRTTN